MFLQDKIDHTFVPAGFDTADMVGISSGLSLAPNAYRAKFEQEEQLHAAEQVRTQTSLCCFLWTYRLRM